MRVRLTASVGQKQPVATVCSRVVHWSGMLQFMTEKNLGAEVGIRRLYIRLIRVRGELRSPDAEAEELRALLDSAPDVEQVESLERHPKGGCRVMLGLAWGSLDAFIAYLDSHDWRYAL